MLNYLTWSERSQSLAALAGFNGRDFALTGSGDPERVAGSAITASLLKVLGVAPVVGRPFDPGDELPGAAPVVVLAESIWVRAFGADRSIVGRSIILNGAPHRVVGVVPSVFREVGRVQIGSAGAAQVFVPLARDLTQSRGNHTLRVVARLRHGVSLDQSRDELHRIAAGMETEFPATNRNWGVRIERLGDSMFDPRVRVSLLVLLAAVVERCLRAGCGEGLYAGLAHSDSRHAPARWRSRARWDGLRFRTGDHGGVRAGLRHRAGQARRPRRPSFGAERGRQRRARHVARLVSPGARGGSDGVRDGTRRRRRAAPAKPRAPAARRRVTSYE